MNSLISVAEQINLRLCIRLLQSFTSIALIDEEGMTTHPKCRDAAAVARRLSYEDRATIRVYDIAGLPRGDIQISIEDDDWVYAEGDGQDDGIENILVDVFGEN
jgi:hypothetical protein